jgi:hypothetical protein
VAQIEHLQGESVTRPLLEGISLMNVHRSSSNGAEIRSRATTLSRTASCILLVFRGSRTQRLSCYWTVKRALVTWRAEGTERPHLMMVDSASDHHSLTWRRFFDDSHHPERRSGHSNNAFPAINCYSNFTVEFPSSLSVGPAVRRRPKHMSRT